MTLYYWLNCINVMYHHHHHHCCCERCTLQGTRINRMFCFLLPVVLVNIFLSLNKNSITRWSYFFRINHQLSTESLIIQNGHIEMTLSNWLNIIFRIRRTWILYMSRNCIIFLKNLKEKFLVFLNFLWRCMYTLHVV